MTGRRKEDFTELRKRAEELLAQREEESPSLPDDVNELLHELEVHQEELEIQNEELKRAKEELNELHREYVDLYELAPVGYVTLSSRGIVTRINLRGAELLGEDRSTLYRSNLSSYFAQESTNDYHALLRRAGESERQHSAELALRSDETGKSAWVRCNARAVRKEGERVTEWRLSLMDITESKEMQQRLEETLREKDFLMKEVNHRVKNNLSIISSLINIKDRTLGEAVDLSNVRHQIDAIRIIHSQLYGKEDITRVRMRRYLRELLETLFAYMAARRVRITEEIEDLVFSPRTAVPLGLIVNEIATNAMKHGFNDDEEARFSVELSRRSEGEGYVLELSNSGNPLPESVDVQQPESFGMQLVSTLVQQLEGRIELTRKPQPRFTILFPGEEG